MIKFISLQTRPSPKVIAGLTNHFKNVDKKMAEAILNEVMDGGPLVKFTDIGKLY